MYLFDLEGYDCSQVPTDWALYGEGIRESLLVYRKCITNYFKNNQSKISSDVINELTSLIIDFYNAYSDVEEKINDLVFILNATPLNCYDKSSYNAYIVSYKSFIEIGKKITNLITTGGSSIGSQPDIEVISTIIYPTDGIIKPKITKCSGVYMKQMDNGSEFLGKVSGWEYFDNRG